jgi:hypothetical protein
MSSTTFTRYECDWCQGQLEVTHESASLALAERPPSWMQAQFEHEPQDLCASCSEALRALVVSRRAGSQRGVREEEFAPS